MRYLFLVMMSVFILLNGCGKNTNQINDNSQEEKPVKLEEPQTFIEVKQEGEEVHVTLVFQNNSTEDVELAFSSGQQFEVIVLNENNEEVYRYSKDKAFIQAFETKIIKSGSNLKWQDVWNISDVKSGYYSIKGNILVSETSPTVSEKYLSAESSIQIEEKQVNENSAFRNVNVTEENGKYIVKGEARVFEATFNYRVTDGHSYLMEDFITVNEGAPSWSPFQLEILLTKEKIPQNGTLTLELFEQSAKDGSDTNKLIIPLESF